MLFCALFTARVPPLARVAPGEAISIHQTPRFTLIASPFPQFIPRVASSVLVWSRRPTHWDEKLLVGWEVAASRGGWGIRVRFDDTERKNQ